MGCKYTIKCFLSRFIHASELVFVAENKLKKCHKNFINYIAFELVLKYYDNPISD